MHNNEEKHKKLTATCIGNTIKVKQPSLSYPSRLWQHIVCGGFVFCYAIIIICVLLLRKREWLFFFNLVSWPLVTVGFLCALG